MRRMIWTGTAIAMLAAGGGAAYAVPAQTSGAVGSAGLSAGPSAYTDGASAKALAGMAAGTGAAGASSVGAAATGTISSGAAATGTSSTGTAGTTGTSSTGSAATGTSLAGTAAAAAGSSTQASLPQGAATAISTAKTAGAIADYALDQLGTPYLYGGASPTGFDASGFLYYTYRYSAAGITLPRTIAEQFKQGVDVGGQSLLLPGDAVFFKSGSAITFGGIYIGNREFAAATVDGVKLSSLSSPYWQERYAGARRMTAAPASSGGTTGSGGGSESGLAGPGPSSGSLAGTAYFKGVAAYLAAAKPVLASSSYNRLEEKAELGLQQYEQGMYTSMLESHNEITDLIDALPVSQQAAIGKKSSEIYGSVIPAGLYDITSTGSLKLRKETGYNVTLMQQASAEQLWKQVKAMYPKDYLSLIKQLRLEIKRGAISRTETIGKGEVRLVLDPSDLTPGATERTRWALAHELGRLVTQQGPGGSELDHLGSASAGAGSTGGIIGSAYAGPAPGSSQWAYFRKDSIMTAYSSKFWTSEVVRDAKAGKPMTAIYTKLFFREASAYQAGEDIADAWAAFLLYDKPAKPADRRDEKLLFFYSKPELVKARAEARKGMALEKSYPKTTTFADLIGPRTW